MLGSPSFGSRLNFYLQNDQNAGAVQYTDCDWPEWNTGGLVNGKSVANYDQERYVDVTSETVIGLHQARIDLAHSIGCDGVDPDNIDTFVSVLIPKNIELEY